MKAIGYIVYCEKDTPMLLADGELYFGNHATLFATRRKAERAIQRTISGRADRLGRDFEKEFGKLRILRVRSEP